MATAPKALKPRSLSDPNLSDEEWLAQGHLQGANLGAPQWLTHAQGRRNQDVMNQMGRQQSMMADSSPMGTMLQNPVGDAMRQEAMANAIDPTGAMGFFAARQPKPVRGARGAAPATAGNVGMNTAQERLKQAMAGLVG